MQTLRDTEVLHLLALNLPLSFCWTGMLSFLPLFLLTKESIPAPAAGLLFSLVLLTGLLAKPIMGRLAETHDKRTLMTALLFVAATSFLFLRTAGSPKLVIFGALLLGVVPSFYPLRSAYLTDRYPSRTRGACIGLYTTLMLLLSCPAPMIVGALAEQRGFDAVLLVFSVVLLATGSASFLFNWRRKRNSPVSLQ
jgi:MFS family permease